MGGRVLVIGANRGIGLRFLQAFAERNWTVFGTIRPQTRNDLSFHDLEDTGAKVIDLDYCDERSIEAAAKTYGKDEPLDVLINCAGIEVYPAAWEETTAEHMMHKYQVMTVGPFLATKYFLPNLKQSPAGKLINITSYWASLAENDFGEYISYRVPKAGLNQLTITMAHEFKAANLNITVLALDPGDIPTRLSRWKGGTNMDESIKGMVGIIERATLDMSGDFIKWNGTKIPY